MVVPVIAWADFGSSKSEKWIHGCGPGTLRTKARSWGRPMLEGAAAEFKEHQVPLATSGVRNDGEGVRLRPFFGYYGGKWRDALRNYPPPKYDTIVEPFAGSAGYSLRYHQRHVVLCEVNPVLVGVWNYLIRVKPEEILRIPDVPPEGCVDDLHLPEEAAWLVGFWLNRGTAAPRKRPSKWMRDNVRPGSFWGHRVRTTISSQVEAIRHWKVRQCSYEDCHVDGPATWFVDPPYQLAGQHYSFGSAEMDYPALAGWCRSRSGQVIACENAGADWLPFEKLADVKTTRPGRRSVEVRWTNEAAVFTPSEGR